MNRPFKPSSGGALAKLIASRPAVPNPTGESRVIPAESQEHKPMVESIVRQTDAQLAAQDAILEKLEANDPERFKGDESSLTGNEKLARLVDDDFPFDDSQLEAI